MAADQPNPIEAILGALRDPDDTNPGLGDARCPNCHASDFVKASDLFAEAVRHIETTGDASSMGPGGSTYGALVDKVRPPRRRSAAVRAIVVAIPLALACVWVFRRFGSLAGQGAGMAAAVITVIAALTRTRQLSDDYYERRQRWDRLYMCRQCGQLVKG